MTKQRTVQIKKLVEALSKAWGDHPQLRFIEVVIDAAPQSALFDLYNIPDSVFLHNLTNFKPIQKGGEKNNDG